MKDEDPRNKEQLNPHESECRCHPWNKLPLELKFEILQYLSLPTLRRFMFLSKDCLQVVSSMKIDAMSIHLDDNTFIGHRNDAVTVRVSRKIKTPYLSCFVTHFDLQFLSLENGGCFVAREVIEDRRKVIKVGTNYPHESRYAAALQAFAQFTKWVKATGLYVTMSPSDADVDRMHAIVPAARKFSCSTFGIETKSPALVRFFMQHLQPGCNLVVNEYTQLDDDRPILARDFFDSDVAKCACSMNIHGMTEITDEQLLKLRAKTLFVASHRITSQAVNQIIWQWYEGERRICQMFFDGTKDLSEEVILSGFELDDFCSPEELLEIVSEMSQWRVRELSRPWVGLRSKAGLVIMVKVGRHSCSLLNLDLK
ncbi:hypothetical protein Aduo_011148 [Ancylostoma duodenale]